MRVMCIEDVDNYLVTNRSLIIGNWYEVVESYVYVNNYYIRFGDESYLYHKDLFVTEVEYRDLQLDRILK